MCSEKVKRDLNPTRAVIHIGPDLSARGGIAAVIGGYQLYRAGFEALGYSMIFIPSGGGAARGAISSFIAAWFRLVWLSVRSHVDQVQIHTSVRGSLLRKSVFAVTCMALRRPYLMHVHSGAFVSQYQVLPQAIRILVKWIFTKASRVICLSEHARQQFILAGLVTDEKCRLLYNGIKDPLGNGTEALSAARASRVGSGPLTISFLGKLIEAKGIEVLLKAMTRLPPSLGEYQLLVGGNGDVPAFLKLVREYGLSDRVTYLGWISGEQKDTLLAESAIFVLPSRSEGFPVALVEAMAFGIAVLSTRIPGVVDAVRDRMDGLLFDTDDAEALCSTLAELLSSADLREQLGASARQRFLDQFTIEQISRQLASIYDSVR